jgi:glycosyltransferase involved in cell wall biosynthesis
MKTAMFYSPIKRASASAPSGLQRAASLMIQALEVAGYAVETPDLPLTFDAEGVLSVQEAARSAALSAASQLKQVLLRRRELPSVFVTYHNYYKSPDWIGPYLAQALRIPYAITEASYAARRADGAWAAHHAASVAALHRADVVFASTGRDKAGLEALAPPCRRLVPLPPFIAVEPFAAAVRTGPPRGRGPGCGRVRVAAAAAMRDERKVESFRRLFAAVGTLNPEAVEIVVAGDGPARAQIESLAGALVRKGYAIAFLGAVPAARMPAFLAGCDILAWPGFGEAYGLIFLEAQAAATPVVAQAHKGVPSVVRDGVGGILTDPDQPQAFAAALAHLVRDANLRDALGRAGARWVAAERSVPAAAEIFRRELPA